MAYIGDRLQPLFRPEPLRVALHNIAEAGVDEMQNRVKENTPVDLGTLRASWIKTPAFPSRWFGMPAWQARLLTDVEYAPYVEHGTGLFGPEHKTYEIRPKHKRALSWIDEESGKRVVAAKVNHPGSPGQHMLAIGVAMAEHQLPAVAQAPLEEWKREQEDGALRQ